MICGHALGCKLPWGDVKLRENVQASFACLVWCWGIVVCGSTINMASPSSHRLRRQKIIGRWPVAWSLTLILCIHREGPRESKHNSQPVLWALMRASSSLATGQTCRPDRERALLEVP
jgi:hypothetical protein